MLCNYWYFKDLGFKFQSYACNGFHDLLIMVYDLDDRWFIKLSIMDFGANKTPVEIIKEGEFGGTYFRDIYSSVNGKWYRKSRKEFIWAKDID